MPFSKPINTILLIHDELTQSERLIADYIINNPQAVTTMTVRELAKASYCSPALIMKFIKKLGYESFVVFKFELKNEKILINETIFNSFNLVDNFVSENIEEFECLIQELNNANKIFIYAAGTSKVPALDFSRRLSRLRYNIVFNIDICEEISTLKEIKQSDLVLFISNSGNARELQTFSKIIHNDIVLITNNKNAKLASVSNKIYCLNNTLDVESTSRDYPIANKYSLMYFLDLIFINL